MSDPRPILAFPPPTAGPIPAGRPRFGRPTRPSAERQAQRLAPKFQQLQHAIEQGRALATTATTESDPELVVVFDVAGSVDRFLRATRGVPGLEFLAAMDDGTRDADDDFHFTKEGEPTSRPVPETLYLVMSNAEAVGQLIRLFNLWKESPETKFERGLAPLKAAFAQLRDLRRWSAQDRVTETGLLDAWREDVAVVGGQGTTRVEIELWYRSDSDRRQAAEAEVERLIAAAGGAVVKTAVIGAIDYHSILADLPYSEVQAVLDRGADAIQLLTTESVMLVAPYRPMSVPFEFVEAQPPEERTYESPAAQDQPPRVALIDGLPLANHTALAGRLIIDDPDDLASAYTSGQQLHGTAMASLICHGDLAEAGKPLSHRLYVRPILRPHEFFGDQEVVAPDELFVDLLHRTFRRMFEGDGSQAPKAPGVRIVNLSIGDSVRVFNRRLSPAARLLDWLAVTYNVVIVVSAGNHPSSLEVDAAVLDDAVALQHSAFAYLRGRARHRRLLSPAEAVNAITVGATHRDWANAEPSDTVVDACGEGMPALYGAVGFGYRRSVKPDALMPGGRELHRRPAPGAAGTVTLEPAKLSRIGPGLLSAAPDRRGGPSGYAYSNGTSNAAALATRAAAGLLDLLADHINVDGEFPWPDAQYHPVLVKALLIHAAHWGDLRERLQGELEVDPQRFRAEVTRLLGYGPVDDGRLGTAATTRATLIGADSITDGQRHSHALPLPMTLAASTDWRRLTVTLAWLSDINPRSLRHRTARLSYDGTERILALTRQEGDANAVRGGTIQHEVFEGDRAVSFIRDSMLQIHVDCRSDAGRLARPVRYALVASLEVKDTLRADIHTEVREALRTQVRQRLVQRAR